MSEEKQVNEEQVELPEESHDSEIMEPATKKEESEKSRKADFRFHRSFLLVLLVITLGAFLYMTKMFAIPVLMAAVFAGLFHPLYRWFTKKFKGKTGAASGVTCLILIVGILIPLMLIGNMVAREAIGLYTDSEKLVTEFIDESEGGIGERIKGWIPQKYFDVTKVDWEKSLANAAKTTGSFIANLISDTSKTVFQALFNLFIILFTMFFFFQDGHKLIAKIKYWSPLEDVYEDQLIKRFMSVSRATLKGTLLLGFIQGGLGGTLLLIFGVPSAMLWTVVMVIASIIPMIGPSIVLIPTGIILIISGDVWQGIVIILAQVVVIGNIDNLLRPRLVGKDAQMHELLIFFSTIGGLAVFGISGFIIGPVLTALLLTILDIYGLEFKGYLPKE